MSQGRIVVIGAGGFARETRWLIEEIGRSSGEWSFAGFSVSDLTKLGAHDSRDEVIGDIAWLKANSSAFDLLALGIGDPAARLKLSSELRALLPDKDWPALIHPSVRFDGDRCRFGQGAIICAGVIATVGVVVDEFALINLSCTIGHEAKIGRGSVLSPSVNISGGVKIGEGAMIGTGAQVLQYLTVGDRAVVGAGAVVTSDVPEGVTVVGIPARSR